MYLYTYRIYIYCRLRVWIWDKLHKKKRIILISLKNYYQNPSQTRFGFKAIFLIHKYAVEILFEIDTILSFN
jgi:hypothetical protein